MDELITVSVMPLGYPPLAMSAYPYRPTRRQVLGIITFLASSACLPEVPTEEKREGRSAPRGQSGPPPEGFNDNVDALLDVLLPAERDPRGVVTQPGAREVGAGALLDFQTFVPLAQTQALVPALPDELARLLDDFDMALRAALNIDLDVLASLQEPLTPFRSLSRARQEAAIDEAFDDPARRPLYALVRAVAFAAYLGAGSSDAGLVAVGYPPFDDFNDGLALTGYPRTIDGVLVDYTYNLEPETTTGVDLGQVLDPGGDLF